MLLRSFLSLYVPEKYDNPYPILYPSTPISFDLHVQTYGDNYSQNGTKYTEKFRGSPSMVMESPHSYQHVHSLVSSLTSTPVRREQESVDASIALGLAQSVPFRGYVTLIFGLLFQISLGALWTYGNVIPYIASYITFKSPTSTLNENTYHHYYSLANWSFFLLFTGLTFGVLLGGKVEIYFGPKIAIFVSSLFVIIGFGGTFISLSLNNIYAVLLTYGVLFGFGIGLGYPILTIVCMRWYIYLCLHICLCLSSKYLYL